MKEKVTTMREKVIEKVAPKKASAQHEDGVPTKKVLQKKEATAHSGMRVPGQHPPSWHCPDGYEESTKDLGGASGIKDAGVNDTDACARLCCERGTSGVDGCTGFEFGTSTAYAGCWTYTTGNS